MKKLINLVPPSVKHERNMKKATKSIVYLIIACGGGYGGLSQYEKHVKSQIEDLNNTVANIGQHETSIKKNEDDIAKTEEQKNSISSSSFPYHRFLYFLTVNATDDMRILSVESVSPNAKKKVKEGDDPTATTEGQQTADAQIAASGTDAAVTPAPDASAEIVSPVPGDSTATPTDGTVPVDPNTAPGVSQKEEKSPFNFETSVIYVRGYSIYPDSIAILANKLKEEEYIQTVNVTKIRDYNTGQQNFKLFEMKITYQ